MIIDYDHNPNITNEQRLQSLKESVQMALNDVESKEAASSAAAAASTQASAASAAASAASTAAGNAQTSADAANNALKSVVQGATTVEKAVSVMQTALEAVVDYDPQNDTVDEYFWHDANGAHVLGTSGDYRNDIDSNGMKIVDTSNEESVAEFGANGTRIGRIDEKYLNVSANEISFNKKIVNNSIVSPFKVATRDDLGEAVLTETLGTAGREAWTKTIEYTPLAGTEINVYKDTGQIQMTFTAGIAETISPITYDGDRTFSKETTSMFIVDVDYVAEYLVQSLDSDLQIGTRTLSLGSQILQDKFPRYTIGKTIISSLLHSLTVGLYNKYIPDGLFVVGNGINHRRRSNAFVVKSDGRVSCGDYSGNFKSIYDIFYPKGSYYETSLPSSTPSGNTNPTASDLEFLGLTWFNPNHAWGGTWELEAEGKVLMSGSASGSYQVGTEYGDNTKPITANNLPAHKHGMSHSHKFNNDRVVPGLASSGWQKAKVSSGSTTSYQYINTGSASASIYQVSQTDDGTKANTDNNNTTATDFNVMQKSKAVYIWHRTA